MSARTMSRNERLEHIERMLVDHPGGLRAVEIATRCEVDRRTIYRDIAVLTDNNGLPIYQKNGRFFINRDYYQANLRLNHHESLAMFMALRVIMHHSEQRNPYVLSALKRLGEVLPELPAKHVETLTQTIRKAPVDRGFVSVLDTVTRAWSDQRRVKLWYSSSKRETIARDFAIYFIELTPAGEIYLVGYDSLSERVRAFRLSRVMRARMLRPTYQIPPQFNAERFLANAWGDINDNEDDITSVAEIILKVSLEIVPSLSQQVWHPSQRIERLEDGFALVTLQLTDWRSMLPWIMSWGAKIEVIKPLALRKELAREALSVMEMYRKEQQVT